MANWLYLKQNGGTHFNDMLLFLDLAELQLPKTCETQFPDRNDLLNFKLIIMPDEGYYKGGKFTFSFKVEII